MSQDAETRLQLASLLQRHKGIVGELESMDISRNVSLDKFIRLRIVGGLNPDKVAAECNLCRFRNSICMYKDLSSLPLFLSL